MIKPRMSVVMIFLGAERFLERAIETVPTNPDFLAQVADQDGDAVPSVLRGGRVDVGSDDLGVR